MPVAAEVIQPPMASPFLDTISASVPFDYASPLDKAHSFELSSSTPCEDSQLRTTFYLNSKDDETISSVSSQEFDNITEDEKIQAKNNISPDQYPQEMVRLQLVAQSSTLLPRTSTLDEPINHDTFQHRPFYSPQIQVKLYRPKSLASLHQKTLTPSFGEIDGKGIVTKSVSSSDVSHSSLKTKKNKLLKRFNFHSTRSVPSLYGISEGIDLQSQSCGGDNNGDNSPQTPNRDRRKGLFLWNRAKSPKGSPVTRESNKRVAFSTGNIHEASSDTHQGNGKSGTSFGQPESSAAVTDSRKLENESYAAAGNSSDDMIERHPRDGEPATIKIARRSSFRGGQYCTLVRNFSTVLPPDEIAEKPLVIKDATDVFPLNSGEVLVTDILSNKMVMFNAHGLPKITYAMEPGSEPWSIFVTPDGIMAVTLKGAGCVSLWSPTGESLTEFGEDTLTSPTGIDYDHKGGRFIVADEDNNTILSFSKTGQFLGEFVNQQSPNSAAGNRTPNLTSHDELTFNQPRYICASRDGLRFVSDSANQVIKMFDEEGVLLQEIGSYGKEDGQFRFPYGVAFDDETKLLYVADHYNNRISVFSLNGSFLYNILTQADGITRPKGLAVHRSKLYVTFGNLRAGNISVYRIHANQDS